MKMVIKVKEAVMIGHGDSYQHMQDDGAGCGGWSLELEEEKPRIIMELARAA